MQELPLPSHNGCRSVWWKPQLARISHLRYPSHTERVALKNRGLPVVALCQSISSTERSLASGYRIVRDVTARIIFPVEDTEKDMAFGNG
jgi:hypothetical protein